MADAVSPVVDRLVARIGSVSGIGRVHGFNVRDRTDFHDLVVSSIDGMDVMRAWWVQGPTMEAAWLTPMSPQQIARTWTYQIHGIEGLSPAFDGDARGPGEDLQTLRDNAVAVCDAIDSDTLDLGGTVFSSKPCIWREQPQHRTFGEGFGAAYLVIEKSVKTMPART